MALAHPKIIGGVVELQTDAAYEQEVGLMSIRYAVGLIPEPSFTARVYQVRQIVCGQYASWAAEMHLLHLTMVDSFECPNSAVESVSTGLAKISEESRHRVPRFPLLSRGASTTPGVAGNIHLDFTVPANPLERNQRELNILHREVIELLEQTESTMPGLTSASENFHPRITLMEHANLPPTVFDSAVEFARAVLRDLQVPNNTRAWQMVLLRFESEAAGDDWDNGSWAADLRWQLVAACPL
jgi:2'-5' RNA ligase